MDTFPPRNSALPCITRSCMHGLYSLNNVFHCIYHRPSTKMATVTSRTRNSVRLWPPWKFTQSKKALHVALFTMSVSLHPLSFPFPNFIPPLSCCLHNIRVFSVSSSEKLICNHFEHKVRVRPMHTTLVTVCSKESPICFVPLHIYCDVDNQIYFIYSNFVSPFIASYSSINIIQDYMLNDYQI